MRTFISDQVHKIIALANEYSLIKGIKGILSGEKYYFIKFFKLKYFFITTDGFQNFGCIVVINQSKVSACSSDVAY